MILLVILILISTTVALLEGDLCQLSNKDPGTCTLMEDCPFIYRRAEAGHLVDKPCGFARYDAIVCCPVTSTRSSEVLKGDGRGEIARQKCAEYARSVTSLKIAPILSVDPTLVKTSDCAIDYNPFVVGGTQAKPKEFPHMAALGYIPNDEILWRCGGTLISESHVLTAAHCTATRDLGSVTWVRLGVNNLNHHYGNIPMDRLVTDYYTHPRYKPSSRYHDIALLVLEAPVKFNAWIRPACLHTAPATEFDKAIATGWGDVEWAADEGSNDLLKVTVPFVDHRSCNNTYMKNSVDHTLKHGIIGNWMVCAGEPGKDTCQGDSGGPLVIHSLSQYYCMYDIVGVTSSGRYCGSIIPGIYMRVYHYINWIEPIVWSQG